MGRGSFGWCLVLAAACGSEALPTDAGAPPIPLAPCGIAVPTTWRIVAIDDTVHMRTEGPRLSYGVDLDGTDEAVCGWNDAVDPSGLTGIDDALGEVPSIVGTDGVSVEGELAFALTETSVDGVCAVEVSLGGLSAIARGTDRSWRAGPLGAVFASLTVLDVEHPITVRDAWVVMRDGELHVTGAIVVSTLIPLLEAHGIDATSGARLLDALSDLDPDANGDCRRGSIVLATEPVE